MSKTSYANPLILRKQKSRTQIVNIKRKTQQEPQKITDLQSKTETQEKRNNGDMERPENKR